MNTLKTWVSTQWRTRRSIAATLALALALSFGGYEVLKPAAARAATAAPAAAALDDNSVSPLLALDQAMEKLAAHVTPAVVNVSVTSRGHEQQMSPNSNSNDDDQNPIEKFFGPGFGGRQFQFPRMHQGPQIEHGVGSGVIISPDGYIVTNNHVVDGAVDIHVTMNDRRVLPAKLIGADPLTDLAVIKIDASNLPSLPWGDSTTLKPGQTVLAFGNPFNFRFTVTRGIVSAVNRPNPFADDRRKPGQFIQTDAAINPGNSGGPLVDARGEVIGINTFLISGSGQFSGMGFAIPTQVARPTVEALLKYGKVEHARVGIGITDVTPENAKFFNMEKASGALVSQVEPDSPGARAGLKVGDVITGINGKKIEDSGQLQVMVSQDRPGSKVNLEVYRDGKSMTVPVTLAALNAKNEETAQNGQSHGKARWGLGLQEVTPDIRQELQLPSNINGVVVGNVQPGSPADNAGISQGDVIQQVNRHDVRTPSDVQRELNNVKDGQDALVLIWSRGGSAFLVMHGSETESAQAR